MKKKKIGKYDKFIDWCLDECWRIQKELFFTSIRVKIKEQPTKTQDNYAFEVTCGHPYQWAVLNWQEDTFLDWKKDKNKITAYLLHEILHMIVQPFSIIAKTRWCGEQQYIDAEEELVDRLTNILRFGILKKNK